MFLATGFVVAGAIIVGLYSVFLYRTVRKEGLLDRLNWATLELPWREVFGFMVPLLAWTCSTWSSTRPTRCSLGITTALRASARFA